MHDLMWGEERVIPRFLAGMMGCEPKRQEKEQVGQGGGKMLS